MGEATPSSSIDSSEQILSTDLRLGLTLSSSTSHFSDTLSDSDSREQPFSDCQELKTLRRSTRNNRQRPTFFVKVYMEGVPIGRKLDLFAHHGYDGLITTLTHMFSTTILYPDTNRVHSHKDYVITYEDKEGDWMMVGDVPWEMFLTTVKRLKITRADRC